MDKKKTTESLVYIPHEKVTLVGSLAIPEGASGIVLFAHGSGSSRLSPRNNFVAEVLRSQGLATLLLDLLTPEEDSDYEMRFDINLLAHRLVAVTKWLQEQAEMKNFAIGYFGASTGAAAAIQSAAVLPKQISAIVSRGGRPDLAMAYLAKIEAPTLLIVGGYDDVVIELNKEAYDGLACIKKMEIVPGATHLFEETGTLEKVAELAAGWFEKYLGKNK